MLNLCYTNLSKFASATAISLTGNFNKVLSILVGAAIFHNPLSLLQAFGLSVCIAATWCFSQKGALPADKRAFFLAGALFMAVLYASGNLRATTVLAANRDQSR